MIRTAVRLDAAADGFNSLFEMLNQPARHPAQLYALGFNSLFEMRHLAVIMTTMRFVKFQFSV